MGNLHILEQAEAAYAALGNQSEEPEPPELEDIPGGETEAGGDDMSVEENGSASGGVPSKTAAGNNNSPKKEQKQGKNNKEAENKENGKREETEQKKNQKIEWAEGEVKPEKAGAQTNMATKKMEAMKKQKKNLKTLGIILGVLAVITAGTGIAVKAADKQRKKKEVHY